MTTREFFQNVQAANISDEMTATATLLIQKLDEKNAKRKSADTKEKREVAARRQAVSSFFAANRGVTYTRDDVAAATGLSPAQVTACISPELIPGIVTTNIKVGKAKRVAYTLPEQE